MTGGKENLPVKGKKVEEKGMDVGGGAVGEGGKPKVEDAADDGGAVVDAYLEMLTEALNAIYGGASSKDNRHIVRVMRKFSRLRHMATVSTLSLVARSVVAASSSSGPPYARIWASVLAALDALAAHESNAPAVAVPPVVSGGDHQMTDAASTSDAKAPAASGDLSTVGNSASVWKLPKHGYADGRPNIQVFLGVLVLVKLIDQRQHADAVEMSKGLIAFVNAMPRRTVDEQLSAKAYFYFSRAYELNGNIEDVRQELISAYRLAVLHRDSMKQAVTLTCLLRNYLHFSHYDLAIKLVSKASLPETLRSNSQTARHLYYLGRLQAVQQDYSDAHASLMEAVGNAPQPVTTEQSGPTAIPPPPSNAKKANAADDGKALKALASVDDTTTHSAAQLQNSSASRGKGFRLSAHKFAIVVELLMGGIPDRTLFNQRDLRRELMPYKNVVDAVRSGDLSSFRKTTEIHRQRFEKDGTLFLIQRLHRNVIRTGIRTISLSYSHISLADVATKLGLESAEEAEGICSKAVVDGVIEATIDHDTKSMRSKAAVDVYKSNEPAEAFHKRIGFCLQLHNEAVEAMQYPEEMQTADDKATEAEARRKEMQEHLARAEEIGDDDDVDMM